MLFQAMVWVEFSHIPGFEKDSIKTSLADELLKSIFLPTGSDALSHSFFLPCPALDCVSPFGILIKFAHIGVSKNRGTPKWMVYKGKPY